MVCSKAKRLNIVKISHLPKLINRFNAILVKIPVGLFLADIDKLILKFIWKCKEARIQLAFKSRKKG